MAKNRFEISTVFDFDGKKFDRGIRSSYGSVNTFARKTANRFNQAAHSMVTTFKRSGQLAGKGFSQGFKMGVSSLAVGAYMGKKSNEVLERKYLAQSVGVDGKAYDKYNLMAKKVGLTGENVIDTIEELHNKIGMSKIGNLEAGIKDFAQATHLTQAEFKKIQKMKPEKQFKTMITMLNKLDMQTARSVADSVFGGEGNKLYGGFRNLYGGNFANVEKEYNKFNLLTDKNRKGNEDFADRYNKLAFSINSAIEDVTGTIGGELAPALGYAQDKFSSFYKTASSEAELFSSQINKYFGESADNVKAWGAVAAAVAASAGGLWMAKKTVGKAAEMARSGLGLPDKNGIQKVFVVNMAGGSFGDFDSIGGGKDDHHKSGGNNKKGGKGKYSKWAKGALVADAMAGGTSLATGGLATFGAATGATEFLVGLMAVNEALAQVKKYDPKNSSFKNYTFNPYATDRKKSVPIATPTGGVTHAAGFAGDSVTLDKTESYLARIADRLDKMETLPSGEQQRSVITPYGAVQVSSTSEY